MKKQSLFVGGLCFSVGFLLSSLLPGDVLKESVEPVSSKTYLSQIKQLNSEISALNKEITMLKNRRTPSAAHADMSSPVLFAQNTIASQQNPPVTEHTEADDNSADSRELHKLRAYKVDHHTGSIRQSFEFMQASHLQGVRGEMNDTFDSEPMDPNWSSGQEAKLINLFSGSEALAEFSVVSNDCKSSLCRVSIISPHQSETAQLSAALSQELYPGGVSNDFGSYITVVEPETGLTHIYVSRDEQSFNALLQEPQRQASTHH